VLAEVGADGIYEPGDPNTGPVAGWTDQGSPGFERALVQHHCRTLAEWDPWRWVLAPVVVYNGRVVGSQDAQAEDFPVARSVTTAAWLGRAWQGRGLGREMREAILHLAFEGLGAEVAYDRAWEENAAALSISRSLGYRPNGTEIRARGNDAAVLVNMALERSDWQPRRRDDVEITGLEACRELFTGW
jgi:RimJ/RimL family protein N-acetyltransferase